MLFPCVVQIFLLAAPPSKLATAVFRLQLHGLSGAVIALLFPVTNTRLVGKVLRHMAYFTWFSGTSTLSEPVHFVGFFLSFFFFVVSFGLVKEGLRCNAGSLHLSTNNT